MSLTFWKSSGFPILWSHHAQVRLPSAQHSPFPRENNRILYILRIPKYHITITVNFSTFQASFPTKKLHRISMYIFNYLLGLQCTKHQLFSPLGHMNFTIISQGWSFLFHLLTLSAWLCCLRWCLWNGAETSSSLQTTFPFFLYDDHISQPEDCTPTQNPTSDSMASSLPFVIQLLRPWHLWIALPTPLWSADSVDFFKG